MNNYLHHFAKGSHTIQLTDYYKDSPHTAISYKTNAEVIERETAHHLSCQRHYERQTCWLRAAYGLCDGQYKRIQTPQQG